MSLIDEYSENFTIIDKQTVPDGYGGVETVYTDGATIQAALSFDNSTEGKTAQAAGITNLYTLTVKKTIQLDFHTVLRRESNGEIYRLTDDGTDNRTPASASLDMRQYSMELWKLPID